MTKQELRTHNKKQVNKGRRKPKKCDHRSEYTIFWSFTKFALKVLFAAFYFNFHKFHLSPPFPVELKIMYLAQFTFCWMICFMRFTRFENNCALNFLKVYLPTFYRAKHTQYVKINRSLNCLLFCQGQQLPAPGAAPLRC